MDCYINCVSKFCLGEKVVDHVKDYLTPSDIHKYGLTCILKSMVDVQTREPLLNTLYPDVDFAELTQKYLPDNGWYIYF